MRLSPFCILKDHEKSAILILDTHKLWIGQLWMFRTGEEFEHFIKGSPNFQRINPYNIAVFPYGSLLQGTPCENPKPMTHTLEGLQSLARMADFYREIFILPHGPRYKRYLSL